MQDGNSVYHSENNCLIETESHTMILGCCKSIIPDSIKCIGDYAFSDCTSLQSITIPDSVIDIENRAFDGCTSLQEIYYTGNRPFYDALWSILKENRALLHWIFNHPSNFHRDDILCCFKNYAKEISAPELVCLENYGFITQDNALELLEILRESGNVEGVNEMIRYLSSNRTSEDYMETFRLDLE